MTYQFSEPREPKLSLREKIERNKQSIKKVTIGIAIGAVAASAIVLKGLRQDVDALGRHVERLSQNDEVLRLVHNATEEDERFHIQIK